MKLLFIALFALVAFAAARYSYEPATLNYDEDEAETLALPCTVDVKLLTTLGVASSKAKLYTPHLLKALEEGKINTKNRIQFFLAQVLHESANLYYFEEIASGADYEGRKDLGNIYPGDGKRFKGRGPIQLTGRSNYANAGKALGLDLIKNPTIVATPAVGFRTTVWFWVTNGLNGYADKNDFIGATKVINGGTNGLADRQSKLAKIKKYMKCA